MPKLTEEEVTEKRPARKTGASQTLPRLHPAGRGAPLCTSACTYAYFGVVTVSVTVASLVLLGPRPFKSDPVKVKV